MPPMTTTSCGRYESGTVTSSRSPAGTICSTDLPAPPLVSCVRSCFAVAGACDTAARAPFACRYGPIRYRVTLGLLRTDLQFGTLVAHSQAGRRSARVGAGIRRRRRRLTPIQPRGPSADRPAVSQLKGSSHHPEAVSFPAAWPGRQRRQVKESGLHGNSDVSALVDTCDHRRHGVRALAARGETPRCTESGEAPA